MGDNLTVILTEPIKAHGQELEEITFKEPTGEEIMVCGYPLQIADGSAIPITTAIGKYISKLTGIPPNAVKKLHRNDFAKCTEIVLGFFGEETEAS